MDSRDSPGGLEELRLQPFPGDSAAHGHVGNLAGSGVVDDADVTLRDFLRLEGEEAVGCGLYGLEGRLGSIDVSLVALPGVRLELMGLSVEYAASL
jgi:hypothetical protein